MRLLKRQQQPVYCAEIIEILEGINTVIRYKKPEKQFFTVSATAGTPEEISAGIVPTYDRYLTWWNSRWNRFDLKEGMLLWVDVMPELDSNGDFIFNAENVPVVLPDYRVEKIIGTKKGSVKRYGIVKIGCHDGETEN